MLVRATVIPTLSVVDIFSVTYVVELSQYLDVMVQEDVVLIIVDTLS